MLHQRHEALAMRLLVQRDAAIGIERVRPGTSLGGRPVHDGREVEEALGAQEEAFLDDAPGTVELDEAVQVGMGGIARRARLQRAALGPEAERQRECFEQGRLARAVLADEECHLGVEGESPGFTHRIEMEGIAVGLPAVATVETHREQDLRITPQALELRILRLVIGSLPAGPVGRHRGTPRGAL